MDGLMAIGIKEEVVGEAIKLGSGEDYGVIDLANMVNALTGNEAGVVYVERRDWVVKRRLLSLYSEGEGAVGSRATDGIRGWIE